MSRPELAEYARHGWALVFFEPKTKGPVTKGWNLIEKTIRDPEIAEYAQGNVGLCHAYSGTCALDLDNMEVALPFLAERGIDIDTLLSAPDAVMISSGRENRGKLLYSTPKPLPSFRLPGFELRCAASTGRSVQDVLPPSVHPITEKPYVWIGDWRKVPPLPDALRALWESLVTPETRIKTPRLARAVDASKSIVAARKLLEKHDSDTDYNSWVQVGMALHHETEGAEVGLDLWDEWSAKGSKYEGRADLESHWRSFRADAARPKTIASLRVEETAAPEEFPVITQEEIADAEILREAERQAGGALAPLRPVDDTSREALNSVERAKDGTAHAVLPNLMLVLSVPQLTGTQIRYDAFKDQTLLAPLGTEDWRPFRDTDYTAFRLWLESAARFNPVGRELIRDAIHYIAEGNKMDSAQEWLASLEWDGTPRIEHFFPRYMGTIDANYERAVGKYLWSAFAGRIMQPGCQVDMAPVLVGPQGVGKTQGIKAMVPDPEFYCEVRLDEPDDAIARKLRGTLVGEIAEMRGINTADRERILAFMTRTHEQWTPKYMEFATTFPRRLVMIGTTNEDDFLQGNENRRWLPLRVTKVHVGLIERDRLQLWAEALQAWMERGVMWGDAQTLAKDVHEEYRAVDPWEGVIELWLQEASPEGVKLRDVLIEALGLDVRTISRQHELRAARALRILGWASKVLREGKRTHKVWVNAAAEELM